MPKVAALKKKKQGVTQLPVQTPKTPIALVFLHHIEGSYMFTAIACDRVDCCDLALKVSQDYPDWTIGASSWIVPAISQHPNPSCRA